MQKPKARFGVLPRIFVAIVLGVVFGLASPDCGVRALNCFGATFAQFIKFIVPFIILGFVTPAIAETGRSAGRTLLLTVAIAWCSTVLFGYLAYFASSAVFPSVISGSLGDASQAKEFPAYFKIAIPPAMDVVTALAVAFMFGFAIVATNSETLRRVASETRNVVNFVLGRAFVPLLPVYVFTMMADLSASGKLLVVGESCVKIMAVAVAMSIVVLLVQFSIAGAVAGKNPLKALWTMLPAYLTGLGCCSSAATIPYTMAQARKNGVSDETSALVIPLCSNIHMAGSMSNMVVYAAGLLALMGRPLDAAAFTEFILMVSVIAVASPGVPGGIVLASATVAETALGFTSESYAIMVAIYMALDGMGTACNLTGDGAIALVVDRFSRPSGEVPSFAPDGYGAINKR